MELTVKSDDGEARRQIIERRRCLVGMSLGRLYALDLSLKSYEGIIRDVVIYAFEEGRSVGRQFPYIYDLLEEKTK